MLTPRAWVAGLVIVAVVAIPVSAGTVWLDPDPANVAGNPFDGPLAAHARYRVDQVSWDMLLDHDRTPGNSNDVGTADLGKQQAMNGNWYDFSLDYQPGRGFVFAMVNRETRAENAIQWQGELPGEFNTLVLESRAQAHPNQSRSLDIANLVLSFAEPTNVQGSFGDLNVSSTAAPASHIVASTATTYALADFNLAGAAWTLVGSIKPWMSNNGSSHNPQENLRFSIDARQSGASAVTSVPEPGTLALLAIGACILPWRAKIKRRQRIDPLMA